MTFLAHLTLVGKASSFNGELYFFSLFLSPHSARCSERLSSQTLNLPPTPPGKNPADASPKTDVLIIRLTIALRLRPIFRISVYACASMRASRARNVVCPQVSYSMTTRNPPKFHAAACSVIRSRQSVTSHAPLTLYNLLCLSVCLFLSVSPSVCVCSYFVVIERI